MESPLGSTISEVYISHIENKIFKTITKLKIYIPYVDIFIASYFYDEINELKLKKKFCTNLYYQTQH